MSTVPATILRAPSEGSPRTCVVLAYRPNGQYAIWIEDAQGNAFDAQDTRDPAEAILLFARTCKGERVQPDFTGVPPVVAFLVRLATVLVVRLAKEAAQ